MMTPLRLPERRAATSWHRLDPLTRLTVGVATMLAAVLLGGVVCPLLLALVAVVLPAGLAGVLRDVLRTGLLLALPLALSVAIINVLFATGTTEQGIAIAAEVVVRVLTMAAAAVLFYATTRPSELVASLQYHGTSPRLTFVIHNGVAMIPRMAERAREVTAAQRARGLDTEGAWPRRVAGRRWQWLRRPCLGALREVESRTLALETRAFTRPGSRTVLWPPHDTAGQRVARWGMALAVVALTVARVAGVPLPC